MFQATILHCNAILVRVNWPNEMIFVRNHAPGAALIARPIDQQSSALPLCYGRPHNGIPYSRPRDPILFVKETVNTCVHCTVFIILAYHES